MLPSPSNLTPHEQSILASAAAQVESVLDRPWIADANRRAAHRQRVLTILERHKAERKALALDNPDDRPCKNEGFVVVGNNGECLRCGADQGERCRR